MNLTNLTNLTCPKCGKQVYLRNSGESGNRRLCQECSRKSNYERQAKYLKNHPEYVRNRVLNEREKTQARSHVKYKVKIGDIIRPENCECCKIHQSRLSRARDNKYPLQQHHPLGYSKEHWEDVTWLCRACHEALDHYQKETEAHGVVDIRYYRKLVREFYTKKYQAAIKAERRAQERKYG